jgi:hypothetical protein
MRNRFKGLTVRQRLSCVVAVCVFAASLQGQQSQGQQPQGPQSGKTAAPPAQTQGQSPLLEIWQIDLNPTGTAFALGKPTLEGDTWVYSQWPEKTIVRRSQTTVKKISRRTKDLNKESVYRIDLVPSGRMIAREKPKLQGGSYVFYAYKNGTVMSLRTADVKAITRLTGLPAFRAQQEEMGAALIDDLPMEGGSAQVLPVPGSAPDSASPTPAAGNWTYQGVPGVTDAYAPANATVESPGDVPRAPAPAPTEPPH